MPPRDRVTEDSRLAGLFFGACLLLFFIGAALELNTWPGGSFLLAVEATSAKDLFYAFQSYAGVVVILFWTSSPSRAQRGFVLLGTAVALVAFWLATDAIRPRLWPRPDALGVFLFVMGCTATPTLLAVLWRLWDRRLSQDVYERRFAWLACLTLLFIMVPQSALSLSASLHPATLDAYALRWDHAAGLAITPQLIEAVQAVPGLSFVVRLAYNITPLVFIAVPLLQLRGKPAHTPTALLMWVGMTSCAMLAYHFFPVTGPQYVWGSGKFVAAVSNAGQQPLALAQVAPYPRNGMPSMHFGWLLAASLMWWQMPTRWWSRAVMLVATVLTAVATLYLGEHYTVDLVVAVPFVLACVALCSTALPWRGSSRGLVVATGFACWLAWVLLLRLQIELFIAQPWLCQLMLLATAAVVVQQVRWMRRFAQQVPAETVHAEAPGPAEAEVQALADERRLARRFGLMFFVSGAAALVYQVLFAKRLALVFGSTATATFTVLATFLGGMALGSLLGGRLASRSRNPLVAYALIEAGIAAYCVLTPTLFGMLQSVYVQLAGDLAPDAPALLALRVVLGAVVLLVPTMLMGATLPLLTQALGRRDEAWGQRVAWLYFANTAGAALGALLTAYFVIPAVGAQRTTFIAALLNLLVALGAIELAKRQTALPAPTTSGAVDQPPAASVTGFSPSARWLAFGALGLGGLLSLGLEVVYVHMLAIVAGNSVYAFGLMLATFLLGLAIGAELARRLLQGRVDPVLGLLHCWLGLALAITIGAWAWNAIPEYFATFAPFELVRSFGAREAVRGLVCAAVMAPPTLFIGASYVLAMEIVTAGAAASRIRSLASGAALNTLGNIAGVLLFGFVLLPRLGGLDASRVVSWAALGVALWALVQVLRHGMPGRWQAAGLAALTLGIGLHGQTLQLNYAMLNTGSNVYFAPQLWGDLIDHAESIDGGLTAVTEQRTESGTRLHTLLTNGKFQGNDAIQGEMQAQIGFALAPLLHQDRRDNALVIGYGTGVTSRVFHEAGFAHLDIAELSGDIVRMANRHFAPVNREVSSLPGVQLHLTDGRNLLLLTRRRYDVISIEITSIWFAGAASLYNREFYQLARAKMTPEGVLQQWVQLHRLTPLDILPILASLRAEFAYVSLYRFGNQGIIVATNDAARSRVTPQALQALQAESLAPVRAIAGREASELATRLVLGPEGIERLLTASGADPAVWLSTDDNLRLEYSTPRANVNDGEKTFQANLALLEKHR